MSGRFNLPVRWGALKPTTPIEEVKEDLSAAADLAQDASIFGQDEEASAALAAKVKLHSKIIDEFNLLALEKLSRGELFEQLSSYVSDYVRSERLPFNQRELEQFTEEVIDELVGLGPLEPLLKDQTVSDILINSFRSVYAERFGLLEPTTVRFKDEAHLLRIINKIVAAVGRRVDESSPMIDARLADGSRVNAAIRPVAIDGPLVSIRKFSKKPYSLERLAQMGAVPATVIDLMRAAVKGRISMIVSGGTGSGKTTMLNALTAFISPRERLITIEDSAELQIQSPHVARMETRPPNAEGRGEIRQRDLVKNALRMRPDRIIIGECRGEEAFDMLQAMNTGHEGSMTTIHANNPRDAMRRLEQMVGMANLGMSQTSIRQQIASAIQLVLQLQRLADGTRRVMSVTEVTGMENDVIQMQEIYHFVKTGMDAEGRQLGVFRATGVRPLFLNQLKPMGLEVPSTHFDPSRDL